MTKPYDRIPALWFDKEGCGPSDLALELHPFDAELDGIIPAHLGLRIRAGARQSSHPAFIYRTASELPESGFDLGREQAEALHRQLGEWLRSTAGGHASGGKPSIAELQLLTPYGDKEHMVRLVAATPVLLEIAATALAFRARGKLAAKTRHVVYQQLHRNVVPSDADYAATGIEDSKLQAARQAYEAALDKVAQ